MAFKNILFLMNPNKLRTSVRSKTQGFFDLEMKMAEERKNKIGEWSSKIISESSDLCDHDKYLIRLVDVLYEGDYKSINDDLKERLGNKPYYHKLFQRINEDLERLKTLESRFPYK